MKKRKLSKIILIIIILIFFIVIYYIKNSYVVKINKEKIYLGEYILYLREQKINFEKLAFGKDIWNATIDGVNTEDLAKKNALNSIVFVKIMKNKAKKLNIKLSNEDKNKVKEISCKICEELTEKEKKIIKEKIINKVVKESILQEKVKKYIEEKENLENFKNIYENLSKDANIKKNTKIWDKIKECN